MEPHSKRLMLQLCIIYFLWFSFFFVGVTVGLHWLYLTIYFHLLLQKERQRNLMRTTSLDKIDLLASTSNILAVTPRDSTPLVRRRRSPSLAILRRNAAIHLAVYWILSALFWFFRQTMLPWYIQCPNDISMDVWCLYNVQTVSYQAFYTLHILLLLSQLINWGIDCFYFNWHQAITLVAFQEAGMIASAN